MEKRRDERGSNAQKLEKQEDIEKKADKNHDFNTKTSVSMTKKANYTVLQRFHDGGNDFQLFSPFPRHNKSADSFIPLLAQISIRAFVYSTVVIARMNIGSSLGFFLRYLDTSIEMEDVAKANS